MGGGRGSACSGMWSLISIIHADVPCFILASELLKSTTCYVPVIVLFIINPGT